MPRAPGPPARPAPAAPHPAARRRGCAVGSRLGTRRTCLGCGWAGGWTGARRRTAAHQSSPQSRGRLRVGRSSGRVRGRDDGRAGRHQGAREGRAAHARQGALAPAPAPARRTCAARRRAFKLEPDAAGVVDHGRVVGVLEGEHVLWPVGRWLDGQAGSQQNSLARPCRSALGTLGPAAGTWVGARGWNLNSFTT